VDFLLGQIDPEGDERIVELAGRFLDFVHRSDSEGFGTHNQLRYN
jgi:hypothetical protein